ncbi:hypothetical protein MOUN0_F03774 [Monosporozyma unispora]|nr:TRAPP subunit [Kazachstania unispora]
MPQYFAIVGNNDCPLYETEFHGVNGKDTMPQSLKELNPFILHSSLDIIEDLQWQLQPNNRSMLSGQENNGSSLLRGSGPGGVLAGFEAGGSNLASGFLRSTSASFNNVSLGPSSSNVNNTSSSNAATQQLLKNDNCYLSRVDHFYGHVVTAYITYSGLKLVMVHCNVNGVADGTNSNNNNNSSNSNSNTFNDSNNQVMVTGSGLVSVDDAKCKKFYQEVHELYVKTLLNPFYKLGNSIDNPEFNTRVHLIANKHLRAR